MGQRSVKSGIRRVIKLGQRRVISGYIGVGPKSNSYLEKLFGNLIFIKNSKSFRTFTVIYFFTENIFILKKKMYTRWTLIRVERAWYISKSCNPIG